MNKKWESGIIQSWRLKSLFSKSIETIDTSIFYFGHFGSIILPGHNS